jgi:ABC-type lipoprotein release transport system permease subunit
MKSERLAAFIIMLFIIFIASFSIIGSVTMLIIEKKDDIFTLLSIGSSVKLIRRVFFTEGWLITITGSLIGLVLGGVISYMQLKFGIVTFPDEGNYIVQAYPIDIKITDFIVTFLSVTALGTLISIWPASRIRPETRLQQ